MSERNRRTNYMKQSGVRGVASWLILLMFVIKMIYMSYKNGMFGMTFYAYSSALFMMVYILCGFAVVPILKKMVFFQIHHGSYRNGTKVYRTVSGVMLTVAGVIAVILFLFSAKISLVLFGTGLCSFMIRIMAIAIMFWIPALCLKGYMEGLGNSMPGIFSDVVAHSIGLAVTILFQPAFAEYGRKVAALVRQDSYAYAYAACSGGLGLLIGGIVNFLLLLCIRTVFGKELRKRIHGEEMRKTDSTQDILWNFFGSYIKTAFVEHIGVVLAFVLLVLYGRTPEKSEAGAGMIYTGIWVIILPAALLAWQIVMPFVRHLSAIMKQADFHHAKERMSFYLKLLSYSILPYFSAVFALAPLLGKVLFDTEQTDFILFMRIGAVIGCLLCYGIFFRQAGNVLLKPYVRNIYAGLLGILGVIFWFVLDRSGMNPQLCFVYAYMLACLSYILLTGFMTLKKIRIYNRLLRSVVLPVASAVFASAVVFGVYILMEKIPGWITVLVCGVVVYLLHNIVIVLFDVFEQHEWTEIPAKKFPVSFARLIGKY
ncbi:MAG: hypothetical protein IJ429_04165 [Lachnospiraceae bacterium]|nr:hypothetical protein [Lachnospiraceae bacterium]